MKYLKLLSVIISIIEKLFPFFKKKETPEYAVENTLDFIHGIKKEDESLEAEKTLIEAKAKLREKRKAPKKIKVPKDVE